jgi:hypothetical protein
VVANSRRLGQVRPADVPNSVNALSGATTVAPCSGSVAVTLFGRGATSH